MKVGRISITQKIVNGTEKIVVSPPAYDFPLPYLMLTGFLTSVFLLFIIATMIVIHRGSCRSQPQEVKSKKKKHKRDDVSQSESWADSGGIFDDDSDLKQRDGRSVHWTSSVGSTSTPMESLDTSSQISGDLTEYTIEPRGSDTKREKGHTRILREGSEREKKTSTRISRSEYSETSVLSKKLSQIGSVIRRLSSSFRQKFLNKKRPSGVESEQMRPYARKSRGPKRRSSFGDTTDYTMTASTRGTGGSSTRGTGVDRRERREKRPSMRRSY